MLYLWCKETLVIHQKNNILVCANTIAEYRQQSQYNSSTNVKGIISKVVKIQYDRAKNSSRSNR